MVQLKFIFYSNRQLRLLRCTRTEFSKVKTLFSMRECKARPTSFRNSIFHQNEQSDKEEKNCRKRI